MTLKLNSRNLRNYLIALGVLIICASAYRVAASFLLYIPEVAVVAPRPPTQNVSLKKNLADLFPADAWQLGDCKRLLTSNGALLFQDWHQVSEDQWKLEPLTIIVGRGLSDEATEAPIVLTAKQGAEIQFAHSLDMMGGSAPPIKMGRMIGDVLIERAGNIEPGKKLAVQTKNVRIDNQKVWTTEEITMQVGNARLRGRDLTIYLAASAASATKATNPATILDRMDLVYLEELRIPLDQTPDGAARPRRIGTKAKHQDNGVVIISCKNGMAYDFALDRLSLRDSISMVRSIGGRVVDRFDCDTLDLVLRDPTNQTVQRNSPLDWIDQVHATGRPAKLSLESYDFKLSADEIDFDAIGGLLRAEGSQGIVIHRGNIHAKLARLAYQYNPETPQEIGVIDVLGAGDVVINDPDIVVRRFSWSEGFKLQPTGRATLDAVKNMQTQSKLSLRVDGDVQASLSDGGTMKAGSIEGLLKLQFVDEPSQQIAATENGSWIDQRNQKRRRKISLVPEVFHAMDAVSIDTNEIVGAMNQLSLYFEQSADFGKRPATSKGPLNLSMGQQSNPARQQPGSLAGFSDQAKKTNEWRSPVARPRPEVSGDQVSAKLLITPDGIQPKDVSVRGNVRVKHQISVGDTVLPIELSGDTMRLLRSAVSQASGQDYLQLGSGPDSPARLKMGDGYFIGPVIKVWPSDNVVQVAGAGELKVPSEILKQSSKDPKQDSAIDVSGIDWISTPHCRWGGSMQFDGQIALINGGVQIDAEVVSGTDPWLTTMSGDEMQIALTQPIRMMDRESMANAEIASISLVQSANRPVFVRAEQRSIDQEPQAIHLITARRIDFAPAGGGELLGTGPGWYRGWMMTKAKSSILSPQSTASSPHLAGQVLQGVHLTFREAMRGDLKNQTLTFSGGVRSGVRKLQSWDDAVDVQQMERLAVGEMTMDCSQLRFGITPGMPDDLRKVPGMPTPWEMTAEGGVVVRTNTDKRGLIEGTANRASYESKKSWLVVEGAPGQSAFVRQTWPDGKKGFQTHSPRMMLNLKTYDFQTIMQDVQINNVAVPAAR